MEWVIDLKEVGPIWQCPFVLMFWFVDYADHIYRHWYLTSGLLFFLFHFVTHRFLVSLQMLKWYYDETLLPPITFSLKWAAPFVEPLEQLEARVSEQVLLRQGVERGAQLTRFWNCGLNKTSNPERVGVAITPNILCYCWIQTVSNHSNHCNQRFVSLLSLCFIATFKTEPSRKSAMFNL